ncbi:MAG: hypothetical protein RMA76_18385 [Deltaproteobacteria bacterium]|jgi:hypothetical protein
MVRVLKGMLMATVLGGALLGSVEAYAQSGRRVVRIREVRIEGRIQKPQAFYILQRSNLNFEGLELKNSFVPKIIKSVEKAPF